MPSRASCFSPWKRRALGLGALAFVACHGEADEAHRAEAGRVARAVQSLRDAPNDEKRARLVALRQQPCTVEDVCALRDTCVTAYSLEVEALDSIAAVRRATREPSAPVPPGAGELLARAETEMHRAEGLTKSCADLEGAARRTHRL
jgi:hypothetical protein